MDVQEVTESDSHRNSINNNNVLPQINVTNEDSDTDSVDDNYTNATNADTYSAASIGSCDDTTTQGDNLSVRSGGGLGGLGGGGFATLDPSTCDTLSVSGYQFRRDSIRQSLQSSQIDLGNAIEVNNVCFGYNKKTSVLLNISINVPKGKIYALLGSSGCGKTTLLRLLLGRMKPSKGHISVFGEQPGAKTSHIPGPGVGYMPQELALFTEFTIEETLRYFGSLYHLDSDYIENRIEFLIKLLNLPPKNRKVSQLSGGQQRRASIAVALFHRPPLLILDEPTVGVDPLLRCRIWEYLESLCLNESMTVIITTHYVEESRSAQTIGFLRFGRILAQSSPAKLLSRYDCVSLEDVFLRLCEENCENLKRRLSVKLQNPAATGRKMSIFPADQISPFLDPEIAAKLWVEPKYKQKSIDLKRLRALIYKNYMKLKGNPALVFFFLILPVVQITLFCESVVKTPDRLPVAVYSPEIGGNLSDAFLDSIDRKMIKQIYHKSLESAIRSVEKGKAWYAIEISQNFSDAFDIRATNPNDMTDDEIEDSKIKLYPDHSDNFIQQFIYQSLFESYHQFLATYVRSIGLNPATVSLPITTQPPVYGVIEYSLIDSIAPGAIVAIIYTTPLLLASFLIVLEKKDGLLERSFVSGVRSFEVLLSHMFTLVLALLVQVGLLMFVTFIVFGVKIAGPTNQVYWLVFMQGLLGIILGLSISAVAPNEVAALLMAFGLVFPMWMICGVFWPLNSVPELLRTIFYMAPLSIPIESIRHIITRGWTIEYFDVLSGYLISAGYNIVLFIATVFIFHWSSSE
ncbi:ABC transporter G family member 23-like [Oppia nitens]|uniref:ABC transporter G family member 23-like n=1 Tax=Oppia nitens TaxID=1686743 RepID=UPI0023DA1C8D|nr:ABC transporter G family member 23-like [Oppia nitens]